ncbi:MAG: type II toxin-antitoxin system VapC family toxin [Thiohalocapsa sp. PB-PSB1]|jgi:predicted nucleic acid-binding protein|nr:MAG: hypothetical protein N838_34285 [Thiohalocapsa sp. PB-PSB1]QQO54295.1 MAG: type II toxin-antitoxin system VapC family toxin [Thiohalocapsa sp. PB-PSB1]
MILLDTNVISELLRKEPEPAVLAWLDRQPDNDLYFCSVTKAELELGVAMLPDGRRKRQLAQAVTDALAEFEGRCLDYDCEATANYVAIASESRTHGRPMSVEDMLIAAIARTNECRLATRNTSDFDFLDSLEIENPWN